MLHLLAGPVVGLLTFERSAQMRLSVISPILVVLFLAPVLHVAAQNPTRARTEEGSDVLLYPDGTWKYAPLPPKRILPPGEHKSPLAKTEFKATRGPFSVWVNTDKWQARTLLSGASAEFQFAHKRGDGY